MIGLHGMKKSTDSRVIEQLWGRMCIIFYRIYENVGGRIVEI